MANKRKALIWTISILGVIGAGGFITAAVLNAKRKKRLKEAKHQAQYGVASDPNDVKDTPELGTKNLVNTGSSGVQYAGTPFKNATEGNAFRAWINDKYPSYARQIDLDRTGSYNNSYIRKAFYKYGLEYLQLLAAKDKAKADALQKQLQADLEANTIKKTVLIPDGRQIVRTSPEVKEGRFELSHNRLAEVNEKDQLEPRGSVADSKNLVWYKVKLPVSLGSKEGYIQSSVVTPKIIRIPKIIG